MPYQRILGQRAREGSIKTSPNNRRNAGRSETLPRGGDPDIETNSRWNGRVSITITLATAISLLVLISVGGVLGIGVWIAQKNTIALTSANANQSVENTVAQIRQHLIPAEQQASFIAKRISKGDIDPNDRKAFGRMLVGALAAARQIEAVIFIDPKLMSYAAGRPDDDNFNLEAFDYSKDPEVRRRLATATDSPKWTAPIWSDRYKKTYLNLGYPIRRDGELIGAVVSVVSVRALSSFVGAAGGADAGTRFILYGRDQVLAHPLLADGYPGRSAKQPLPVLAGFQDRILAAIWQRKDRYDLSLDLAPGTTGHAARIDGEDYVFVLRELKGFGPKPLIVGIYFRVADVGSEFRRMSMSLYVGLGALLLSLIAAAVLGRRIARPIVRFSGAATQVRDLNLAEIQNLQGSVFRELNEQSKSFNAMLRALRWFELYVPRKIVDRLVRRGEIGEQMSAARDITVMFTDIAGFSALSENMTAPEVADLVNRHFEIVAGCIDAEDGTVDKFIGDSVMAFWGAPDPQEDAADRACRAALAIGAAIKQENAERAADGLAPIGIRIGIHTGSATVGNIGAPGRINYTIIGDAVNIGQRLEQLGKEVYPAGTDVSILISGATAGALGPDFNPVAAGKHGLKGRAGEVEVFKLI